MFPTSRSTRLSAVLASLLGATAAPALAAKQAVLNLNLKNTTGAPVYGYGFVLKNVTPAQITGLGSNVFLDAQTSAGVKNTVVLFFLPNGQAAPLGIGQVANFTLTVTGVNNLTVSVPRWLDFNLNPSVVAPTPGFQFNADPQFSLFDDPDAATSFDLADVTAQDNVPGVPVSSLNPGTPSGTVPISQETLLNPGFSYSQTVLPVATDNFLYVSGDITDPGTNQVTGAFVYGVQAGAVPEPGPALLLGLGLPALVAAGVRRRG